MSAEILSVRSPDTGAAYQTPCMKNDPDIWFPKYEGVLNNPSPEARVAIALCKACNLIDECLAVALTRAEPVGVWGGRTAVQREHFRHSKRWPRDGLDLKG